MPQLSGLVHGDLRGPNSSQEQYEFGHDGLPAHAWDDDPPLTEDERRDLLLAAFRFGKVKLAGEQAGNHPWLDPWHQLTDAERHDFAHSVEEYSVPLLQRSSLPSGVWKLPNLRMLGCYGSEITSVSPKIGRLSKLEEFDPYTSRGLHWLPYEVRHTKLKKTRISCRNLFGAYRRIPLPKLDPFPTGTKTLQETAARVLVCNELHVEAERNGELSHVIADYIHSANRCSYCHGPYWETVYQCWSYWSYDQVPLLALNCSRECAESVLATRP